MSRLEDIDNAIWSDPDFEVLSGDATLLYLWSWTNPRCGMAGIYRVSRRTMTESKVPEARLEAALIELADARFLFYDHQVIFVRARVKRLRQKTQQIAVAIAKDVSAIPDGNPLKAMFLQEYAAAPWLNHALSPDGLSMLTRGSGDPQPFPGSKPNQVTLTRPPSGGQGQGQGQGLGPSGRGSKGRGAGIDWRAWAAQHVPELPGDMVAMSAIRLHGGGHEVTADTVRAQVLASNPALAAQLGDAA